MLTRRLLLAAVPLLLAQAAPPPAKPLPRVALDTAAGRIVVELDTVRAPITANNFLRYVDAKRLDGTRFYRVAKVGERFGFVQFGISGAAAKMFPPIRHEPTTQTGIKHLEGTLSMARLKPGSATGDITISVGDQPSFDADPTKPGDNLGYAAFGRVVEGMDVIMKIFDAPIDPNKLENRAFKGEVPVAPVVIRTARRIAG
jgi:peptidyl-prolyl cis-trans isomerase A (cyclophilin A)